MSTSVLIIVFVGIPIWIIIFAIKGKSIGEHPRKSFLIGLLAFFLAAASLYMAGFHMVTDELLSNATMRGLSLSRKWNTAYFLGLSLISFFIAGFFCLISSLICDALGNVFFSPPQTPRNRRRRKRR